MRHWFRASVLLAAVGLVGASSPASADEPLRIGMVQGMFRDIQPSMVMALARPFRSLMERQTGLTGDVEILADAQLMAKKINDQKLDLGVFHGFEYAWVKAKHPNLVPISVAMPQGGIVQAAIVVHSDSQAKKLDDLEGESILIPRGSKAHCILYLDVLRTGLPKTAARSVPKAGLTPEEALNAIAAGEYPAALVDASSFTAYQTLQPGAAKRLKILSKSEKFPPGVLLTRKGALNDGTLAKLRDGLNSAHKTAQYKPLMMMWNLQGFENPPADYDQQLEKCLQLYPVPSSPPSTETTKKE
ncbi:phosphate/phosphite/phosphonate ABC transporter substrate-binding protein [Limnoglobus roseus]|uniref:ABC transporter substrate-binding protein n=1 Tax=Limnoglobus roseus TaxID=2598579 RepID=A0A5C1ACG7_9BACT|nr:PhnD/SsuA/transferrin family substrate-binding protein [Limnoglobus roseus]QEL16991.1 hypothetical protein PX52LOC_03967 [Limnoglobus roseus]